MSKDLDRRYYLLLSSLLQETVEIWLAGCLSVRRDSSNIDLPREKKVFDPLEPRESKRKVWKYPQKYSKKSKKKGSQGLAKQKSPYAGTSIGVSNYHLGVSCRHRDLRAPYWFGKGDPISTPNQARVTANLLIRIYMRARLWCSCVFIGGLERGSEALALDVLFILHAAKSFLHEHLRFCIEKN